MLDKALDLEGLEYYHSRNKELLDEKVDKVEGKGLSTNDFTDEYKNKVDNMSGGSGNEYIHPDSGVTAGTYKSVTVNEQGHVTSGTNPTTLSGFGITDAETKGTADNVVSTHNTSTTAHNDIRLLIAELTNRLNALADSDDETLDQMSEIVAYIKSNKELIDSVTTSKVSTSDIIDNLTTNVSIKPLSAAQGVVIKSLIDALETEIDNISTNEITCDDVLSDTSTNPVQNKVIKEAFDGVIDGTTQVGNAKTLDGKSSESFMPVRPTTLTTSIKEKALSLPDGIYFYHLGGSNYTGGDLPTSGAWGYSTAMVTKRNQNSLEITLFSEASGVANTVYNGQRWTEWEVFATIADLANYLPLTGGRINSTSNVPVELNSTNTNPNVLRFQRNGANLGHIGFVGVDEPAFINGAGNAVKYLLHTGNISDYALAKNGTATSANTLSGLTATVSELNYVDGVTSNIQTQLNGKAGTSVVTTSTNGLMSSTDKTKLEATNIAYGTCSTAASTASKVVTISGNENWKLAVGSIVVVKFSNTNSASNVTLNVNNTGAKSIWYNNAVYTSTSSTACGYANRYTTYMYDGTYWVWISSGSDSNTTYTNASLGQGYGTCSTAAATVAKVVTLSSYALTTGGIVAVKFTYDVPASATMNINSKGAKNIFYRGAAITASVIKAGDIATFIYDGTQYQLLTVDRDNNTTYTHPSTHAASMITAGTFGATGVVAATGTDYTTNRIRNTVFTTTDPGAGASTSYANGSIICVYE